MQLKKCAPIEYNIFIAGRPSLIKVLCSEFCTNIIECCVTVTETEYIYNGGSEIGAIVGVRNFPKDSATLGSVEYIANKLGEFLSERAFQKSYMIQGPDTCKWFSTKDKD